MDHTEPHRDVSSRTEPLGQAPAVVGSAGPLRRYDVDWLRIIALALLIVYHCSLWFLSEEAMDFAPIPIRNQTSLAGLPPVMSFLNVWRIPLLFLISGMGVRFAMHRRGWKELLGDRLLRIVVPLFFGIYVVTPLTAAIAMKHLDWPLTYYSSPGHLWFLANIAIYVVVLLPLLSWLKRHPGNLLERQLSWLLRHPALLLLLGLPLVVETLLADTPLFVVYVATAHGFWLGMICFFIGFMLASAGDSFFIAAMRMRWAALALALPLFVIRLMSSPSFIETPYPALAAFECTCWMLTMLGFGARYLNHPSGALTYLRKAVLPVYIIHAPVQQAIGYFVLPAARPALLEWLAVVAGVFSICLLLYELIIRRVKWIWPLFGMKLSDFERP